MSLITIVQGNSQSTFEDMRKALGLSRKDLSDLSGLTQAIVWRIEHMTVADDQAPYDNVREQLAGKPEVVTLFNTLETFALTFPNGKPKAPKKAPKVTTTGFTHEQVAAAFVAVGMIVEAQKIAAKEKKSSVKPFETIMAALAEESAKFNK